MENKYYKLTIFSNEILLNCIVDKETLKAFEKSFSTGKGLIRFTDSQDKGKIKLRNKKLTGYKKTVDGVPPIELLDNIPFPE